MQNEHFNTLVQDLRAAQEEFDNVFWWEALLTMPIYRQRLVHLTAALENLEAYRSDMDADQHLESIRATVRASLTAFTEIRRERFRRLLLYTFLVAFGLSALAVLLSSYLARTPAKAVCRSFLG